MDASIIVAIISLLGTLGGSLGGIIVSSKLTAYRIEQLEKKYAESKAIDNDHEHRISELEKRTDVQEEKIKVANNRISDLERK